MSDQIDAMKVLGLTVLGLTLLRFRLHSAHRRLDPDTLPPTILCIQ